MLNRRVRGAALWIAGSSPAMTIKSALIDAAVPIRNTPFGVI
jgi:hypothetical protein